MTTRKAKSKPHCKPLPVYLDAERRRQLEQIQRRIGGTVSGAAVAAISHYHATLKKEWPDDFN
jgi:hypothetical protein